MTVPPVTFELVRRLEHAALRFSVARLEAIRDRPETGLDLRIERFGAAITPACPAQPELDFVNRIEGLGIGDAARLDQILNFYDLLGIEPWLELAPEAGVEELGAPPARAGARIIDFHGVLYGVPTRATSSTIEVRRADGAEGEAATRLLLEGHGVPEGLLPTHGSALMAAVERAGDRCTSQPWVACARPQPCSRSRTGSATSPTRPRCPHFAVAAASGHSSPLAQRTQQTPAAIW
jgi:hypothetical protein